jgi:tRNA-splicing ligase RtcB (3'-phosphate/5'-hydroxy nucleic acid ligase)
VFDEIPLAYKDIDAVMEAHKDLVEEMYALNQGVCVKG